MAFQQIQHNKLTPSGIQSFKKDSGSPPHPFEIIITKFEENGGISGKVTKYSSIMPDWNIVDTIPIIGIDWNFAITYGIKIYLEILYDKNLNPICPNIRYAKKWDSFSINPATNESVLTYPNLLEFITKKDLIAKKAEIEHQIEVNNSIQTDIIKDIDDKKSAGVITPDYARWYAAKINKDYGIVKKDLETLRNDFSQFFNSTGLLKKQFKSFTLIGYTTKDTSGELQGKHIRPLKIDQPVPVAGINQAALKSDFKLVQCLENDLVLIESCYKGLIPCKIPYPYSQPVYYFETDSGIEEKSNTK